MLSQLSFILLFLVFSFFIGKRIVFIKRNIQLGKPYTPEGSIKQKVTAMILIAFGQKKMFKNITPALLHSVIYVGFILINIEVLEIILDGVIGTHRLFAPILGNFYGFVISFFEILAVLVLIACVVFLIRRNILKIDRFHKLELKGWPTKDANLILTIEIVLMGALLKMNTADLVLQSRGIEHYPFTGSFAVSSLFVPIFKNFSTFFLVTIERIAWWLHIIGIFSFALYVTYSKHLHIFMAFPNTYFSRLSPKGKMNNMESVTQEVKIMLGLNTDSNVVGVPERFGAKDATDLTWKNIMDAYSCTECGRCTAECPANITGKKLSPRKIMMDTRDRIEVIGKRIDSQKPVDDGKSLLGDYISKEEINACTSCNACVEACPVNINPLEIILELRRNVAMEESASPASWNMMFSNIETNFAPWKFSPSDRFKWAE